MFFSTCFSVKGLVLFLMLTSQTSEAQPQKATNKQYRPVVKESYYINNYNPNYKQGNFKGKAGKHLTAHTLRDSSFEEENYKHRPHNQVNDIIIIKKEPVEKKDENYKHQFPAGK